MNYSVKALVLRAVNLSESDKILTMLAMGLGKISVSAKGARGLKSRFAAVSQPFCYGSYELYQGREMYILNSGESITSFFRLQENLHKMALAGYFAQLLDYLTDEYQSYDEALRLTLNCLYALTETEKNILLIKAVYELRLLSLCGYMPDLTGCHICQKPDGNFYFSVRHGALACENCPRDATFVPVVPGVLQAMRYIVTVPLEKIFSFALSPMATEQIGALTEQFTLTHLDRNFKGLDFYKSIRE